MKFGNVKHSLASLCGLLCLQFTVGFVSPGVDVSRHSTLPSSTVTICRRNNGRSTIPLGIFPVEQNTAELASSSMESVTSSPLFLYFMQSLISNGVPTFFILVAVFFTAKLFKDSKGDEDAFGGDTAVSELYNDLYGDSKKKEPFSFMSGRSAKPGRNLGIPQEEYIKIRSWNQKLDSYVYSMEAATKSKAAAASAFRDKSFNRALKRSLEGTDSSDDMLSSIKTKLLRIEQDFLKEGAPLVEELQSLQAQLTKVTIDSEMKKMGTDASELDPATHTATDVKNNETATDAMAENKKSIFGGKSERSKSKLLTEIGKVQMEITRLESAFVTEVVSAVGTQRANGFRAALLGDIAARGTGGLLMRLEDRPLSAMLEGAASNGDSRKKSMFVAQFRGDVTASQVNQLREEITAIVRSSKPGDEAMVVLETGGGTVTGYGLAAAQLQRLKDSGIKLTIAVEQVAASGGYMMSCVADRIVASPMAVLGSIGVITEIPNFYERLKKEGIEFQTVTAGEFKRTLTPTKKITNEDIKKTKKDVEDILTLFRNFVHENRPQLDIDKVATGETWFGKDALDRGLCDELKTVDEVMMDFVDKGYDVFEVEYSPPMESPKGLGALLPAGSSVGADEDISGIRWMVRWLVKTMASEVRAELGKDFQQPQSVGKRYMAKDDWYERVRAKDDY